MKYVFPTIYCLDDILPHIKDAPEFIVAERDHYTVVNYIMASNETFPPIQTVGDAIRRECRGIIFDKSGKIIARRLHKFFNVGEKQEVFSENIPLDQSHIVLDKLDGSMITPIKVLDEVVTGDETNWHIRWGTKMGITDVAMQAEVFVSQNQEYIDFADVCLSEEITPIFEWCSRKQKIVLDYSEDTLVLIAVRDNVSGTYFDYEFMQEVGQDYGIPVVKSWGSIADLAKFLEETGSKEGIEGYIIRFDDGHMVKIKTDWYVRIHRAKDNLFHEKRVVELIINNAVDDVLGFLEVADKEKLSDFVNKVVTGINDSTFFIHSYIRDFLRANNIDRKQFALEYAKDCSGRSIIFTHFDTSEEELQEAIHGAIMDQIAKSLGSQSRVDAARHLWGGHKWVY